MNQTINEMCERLWRVYKITFKADGYAYVGITPQPIPDRIHAHIRTPVNAELTNRLRRGDAYDYETLHELTVGGLDGEGIKAVYILERQEIFRLEKPLNIFGISPTAKRNAKWWGHEQIDTRKRKRKRKRCVHPPREGMYRCSICKETKSHIHFYVQKDRYNGLDSRCKPCSRFKHRHQMTASGVRAYLAAGGVIPQEMDPNKIRWTASEIRILSESRERGWSFKRIQRELLPHRTYPAIYAYAKRYGL